MNYLYLALGLVVGIIFLGMAKNAKRRKAIPYEVIKKLKSSKHMDEYNEWCDRESLSDTVIGGGLILFGLSATFMDSSNAVSNIVAIISLLVFIVGYVMRVVNNKKHLNHFFVR